MIRLASILIALAATPSSTSFDPSTERGLTPHHALIASETFAGAQSLRVTPVDAAHDAVIELPLPKFRNGSITLNIAGEVAPNADAGSRGFVGLIFRLQDDGRFECFYLRPTNGRADDQLRRNHSLQYVSEPEYPWERLRKETPGQYESYADIQPGKWVPMRIEVTGVKARLYVNGASQPSLIVNDLKHGDTTGEIALWVGPGSIGHFSAVGVAAAP